MLRDLLAVVAVLCVTLAEKSPHNLNNKGLEFARAGNIEDALPLFEQACEAAPNNPDFQNNLGVTYMRIGTSDKAAVAFCMALRASPGFDTATDNLKDLAGYVGHTVDCDETLQDHGQVSGASKPKKPQKRWQDMINTNPTEHLPRVHVDDWHKPENVDYFEGREAFILTGAMENWSALDVWDDEWILEHFAGTVVDYYPASMPYSDTHPYRVHIEDVIDEFYDPTEKYDHTSTRGPPGQYYHINMSPEQWYSAVKSDMQPLAGGMMTANEFWMNDCLSDEAVQAEFNQKTHWRLTLVGQEGAGMFIHQDVLRTSSWHAHVWGAKQWAVCKPDQGHNLYGSGGIDFFSPDYEKYPRFRQARCWLDTLHEGEILFYPRDYYHQTRIDETPTLTITDTVVTVQNWFTVKEQLKAECDEQKFRWNFSKELCASLNQCFVLWENKWGADSSRQDQNSAAKSESSTVPPVTYRYEAEPGLDSVSCEAPNQHFHDDF